MLWIKAQASEDWAGIGNVHARPLSWKDSDSVLWIKAPASEDWAGIGDVHARPSLAGSTTVNTPARLWGDAAAAGPGKSASQHSPCKARTCDAGPSGAGPDRVVLGQTEQNTFEPTTLAGACTVHGHCERGLAWTCACSPEQYEEHVGDSARKPRFAAPADRRSPDQLKWQPCPGPHSCIPESCTHAFPRAAFVGYGACFGALRLCVSFVHSRAPNSATRVQGEPATVAGPRIRSSPPPTGGPVMRVCPQTRVSSPGPASYPRARPAPRLKSRPAAASTALAAAAARMVVWSRLAQHRPVD